MTGAGDMKISYLDMDKIRIEAMEFAGVGIFCYRKDGTVVFMDRVSLQLLDLETRFPDPSDVVGLDISTLFVRIEPQGSLRRTVMEKGKARDFELHYKTLTGIERWVHHNSYQVLNPDTGDILILVLTKDITEIKLAQFKEKKQEERALQARKLESLGVLAGGIAHDFNNLLAAIMGNTELAKLKSGDNEAASHHLSQVVDAATQAADLCQQLLAYAGLSRLEIRPLDLNLAIRECLALARLSVSKRSTIDIDLCEGVLPALGDISSVRQILLNLLTNASESMGDGAGSIRISSGSNDFDSERLSKMYGGEKLSKGRYAFLIVEDDGPGMDAATAARIFEPFFTTKFTGRGLGLASVMGFIKRLGGAIELETSPGHGTRFTILLPCPDTLCVCEPEPEVENINTKEMGVVLVADDELLVRDTLSSILAAMGYKVLKAADGKEAVEIFKREKESIRISFLDVTMPRLDGVKAAAMIRETDPRAPVLFISGYDAVGVADGLKGDGPAGFLKKPFRMSDLSAAVTRLMGKNDWQ
ncbi:MAG: response regulator [Desulfobacteraceae bacterium]|jgi:signal transduction histidine kinase/CheY-like chemotaxis protein|nr:MAG: response regulator [Desulfobacteraceae bacterium]